MPTINGTPDNDLLEGSENNDIINGLAGNDVILAHGGDDIINGGTGDDYIDAGTGDDVITDFSGANYIDGGTGIDTLSYEPLGLPGMPPTEQASQFVNIDLSNGYTAGAAAGTTILNIENVTGTQFNDFLTGDSKANYLDGGIGDDYLSGGAGDDVLSGGTESINPSGSNPTLLGGANTLLGGNGNDTLIVNSGNNYIDGGNDNDTVSYQYALSFVNVDLNANYTAGAATGDVIRNVENITGSDFNDFLTGDDIGNLINGGDGDDYIDGGKGGDTLTGGKGNDRLIGGEGNDMLIGGEGADVMQGGAGNDTVSYEYENASVSVNLQTGATGGAAAGDVIQQVEFLIGSAYDDTITGDTNTHHIYGGAGNDILKGNSSQLVLLGEAGNDTLIGDTGNDILRGGVDNDALYGNAGDDSLLGDEGNDLLNGGAGADYIDGGAGNNTVSYVGNTPPFGEPTGVNVNLSVVNQTGNGEENGDQLYNIQNVIGTGWGDNFIGTSGANIFDGRNGSDTVSYVNGTQWVNIDMGANYYNGAAFGDTLVSIENITGTVYDDVITGDDAANILNGGLGNDRLFGGKGNDVIIGGVGQDVLDGGEGVDTLSYEGENAFVNIALNVAYAGGIALGDVITNFENVTGTDYNDFLVGNDGANVLNGGKGNDYFGWTLGNDTLIGGDGFDTLSYFGATGGITVATVGAFGSETGTVIMGNGNIPNTIVKGDNITGVENFIGTFFNDTFAGSSRAEGFTGSLGNDKFYGSGGGDIMDGGEDTDTLTYENATSGMTMDLAYGISGGFAAGDIAYNMENLTGSNFDDVLGGGFGANTIRALGGNDTIYGGDGADIIDGGEGSDTVNYTRSLEAVRIDLNNTGQIGGDAMGDNLISIENVVGTYGNDLIIGNIFDNKLYGSYGDDMLVGGLGADMLDGGEGILDTADYTQSNASVNVNLGLATAQSGGHAQGDILINIENLMGSGFSDTLTGNAGRNILVGGAGADLFYGTGGGDVFIGGSVTLLPGAALSGYNQLGVIPGDDQSNDTVSYANATGMINVNLAINYAAGFALSDTFYGIENITGTDFDDFLAGNAVANVLNGGKGNDYFFGDEGTDTLIGDEGIDLVNYSLSTSGISIDLRSATAQGGGLAQGDILSGIEGIIATGFNDTLIGTTGANTLIAGAGNDTIISLGGADYLDGGEGIDTLSYAGASGFINIDLGFGYAAGAALGSAIYNIENITGTDFGDFITGGFGTNVIDGGKGDDRISGSYGADVLIGGEGSDTVSYETSFQSVDIDLGSAIGQQGGDAQGDVLSGFENVIGSILNDRLIGTDGINSLIGGAGEDLLIGKGGADYLEGGTGDDTASYETSAVAVNINLITGVHTGGDAQGDTLVSVENIIGSNFSDTLTGDYGSNDLYGLGGNDFLIGSGGGDIINGGEGIDTVSYAWATSGVNIDFTAHYAGGAALGDAIANVENVIGTSYSDFLTGDANVNVLTGGLGRDYLTGGAGADVFKYNSINDSGTTFATSDVITDFGTASGDVIDLSAFAADNATFVGTNGFVNNGIAQVNYSIFGGTTTFVGLDNNGDGVLDFQIELTGVHTLTADDFVL